MMTLRQIRHFIAVAETGSISAAAQTAFISQSTLTLAIQQLEQEIGVGLFNRHAKGMTLTHQGHQFLRQAHLILATVDNAKRSLQQSTDQVAGQLIIGVTSLVAGYYLADLLTRFQRAYPNVELRVMEDERPYIEHLLVSGEIDDIGEYSGMPVYGEATELPDDPVERLRRLIDERQAESVEILRGWLETEEERA